MPVPLGARPQASFNEPLELMKDCHRRIENFLDMLIRVVIGTDGTLDDQHRRALEAALTYFREAAPRHTQDEEESLFPRLRKIPAAKDALDRVAALEADHIRAAGLHAAVDVAGQEWLTGGRLPADALTILKRQLEELRELYQRHIAVEDHDIFPLAGQSLSAEDLASIGNEMKLRRADPVSCTPKT